MKKVLFIIVLLQSIGAVAQKAPTDCKRFRNGTFKMTYMGKETRIVRKGNQQLQYFDNNKTPIAFTVKWLDECTFTLTPGKGEVNHPGVPPNAVLTMHITKTSPNSYTQITTANFTKQAITGEIYRVK